MRITEKGQVTISKAIRDRLGVGPGSEVEFVQRNGLVVVEAKVRHDDAGDVSAPLRRHIERHAGSFDMDGMQSDEVYRLLRD